MKAVFDIGGFELLIIGIVALIVVGPKDLPRMFAAVGRFTGKARAMGREFQRAMHEAADETGMADVTKDIQNLTSKKSLGLDKVEEAARKFDSWDPLKDQADKSPTPKTQATAEKTAEAATKPTGRSSRKPTGTSAKKTSGTAAQKKPRATTAKKTGGTAKKTAPKKAAPSKKRTNTSKSGTPKP